MSLETDVLRYAHYLSDEITVPSKDLYNSIIANDSFIMLFKNNLYLPEKIDKAVFLDRDGVLNECRDFRYITDKNDLRLYADVKLLSLIPYPLFIVTNQGGVGLNLISKNTFCNITNALFNYLFLANIFIVEQVACIAEPRSNSIYRKPNSGMIEFLMDEYNITGECWMVGDSAWDIIAGHNAGCKTIALDRYNEFYHMALRYEEEYENVPEPTHYAKTLSEAVFNILYQ